MPQHRKQVTYSQRPNHAARSAHARGEAPVPYVRYQLYPPEEKQGSCYSRRRFGRSRRRRFGVGRAHPVQQLFRAIGRASGRGSGATITVAEGAGAKVVGEQLAEARLVSNAGDFTKRVNEMGVDSQLKPVPTHSRAVCRSTPSSTS